MHLGFQWLQQFLENTTLLHEIDPGSITIVIAVVLLLEVEMLAGF